MNRRLGLMLVLVGFCVCFSGCEVFVEEFAKNLLVSQTSSASQTRSQTTGSSSSRSWTPSGDINKDLVGQWQKVGSSQTIEFSGSGQVEFASEAHRTLGGGGVLGTYKVTGPNTIKAFIPGYTPLEESMHVSIRGTRLTLTRPQLGATSYERVFGTDSYASSPDIKEKIIGKWYCAQDRDTLEFLTDGSLVYIGPRSSGLGTYRIIGTSKLAVTFQQNSTVYKVAMDREILVLEDVSQRRVSRYKRTQ